MTRRNLRKRLATVKVQNLLKKLGTPAKKTPEDYRRLAREMARR